MLLLAIALSPRSAGAGDAATLHEGVQCYSRLDYPCAVGTLKRFLAGGAAETQDREQRNTAYKYLALSYLAIGEGELARQSFVSLLEEQPDFDLDPEEHPPKACAALADARRRIGLPPPGEPPATETPEAASLAGPPVAAAQPAPAPDAAPGGPLSVTLTAGQAVLLGRDGDLFWPGPLAALSATWEVLPRVDAGLMLRYHVHGVREEALANGALHAAGAAATATWTWLSTAGFTVATGGGGGGAAYAGEGLVGVAALEVFPVVRGGYRFAPGFDVVAEVSPTLAVARRPGGGGAAASFYLPMAAGVRWSPSP